jgi:GrpB-like predicted nucleotidyltransferase (UPF0157 family)
MGYKDMRDEEVELGLAQGLVRLTEPTSLWAELFRQEATRLNHSLLPFGAVVEHCGSTSIPGIPAKPILDILVGIPDPLEVAPLREALEPIGYEHATWAGVPGHEVFGKGDPRTHIVHVVPLGGPAWERMLCFRNTLRGDASLASEYGSLKHRLAALHPNNRAAYTDGKASFVEKVLTR